MTKNAAICIEQARLALAERRIIEAIHHFGDAIENAPDTVEYKDEFINAMQIMHLRIVSRRLKSVITLCLADPRTGCQRFGEAWLTFMMSDPAFQPLPKLIKQKKYNAFVNAMRKNENADIFQDPYLLHGMGRLTIASMDFERFLTFLRRYLLEHRQSPLLTSEIPYALARYCRSVRYIFSISKEEKAILPSLGDSEKDQILRACYRHIDDPHIVKNPSPLWSAFVGEEEKRLAEIDAEKASIQALTTIEDSISQKVQTQYETYPFPLWDSFFTREENNAANAEEWINKDMLVAGCGTGQEAAILGITYPKSNITAVDLSKASLAYARIKARKHQIKNITFGQADILKLESLGKTFDFVTCCGVLHHMEDPFAGWSVLKKILNPDGTMRIALYSKTARRAINEARDIIKKQGYTADDEGMRAFRESAEKLMRRKSLNMLKMARDYYNMNELRDLLFHVQEHQFTPAMIADYLDRLNLEFAGFIPPKKPRGFFTRPVMETYRKKFPDDPDGLNLKNWEIFEKKYPDTFIEMYQFFCKKKS